MESSASSNTRLTCPSCRITVMMSRPRSMCPFCGNFYDPIAQINFNLRANRNSIDCVNDELNDDNSRDYNQLRFPRINPNRQQFLGLTGFYPLLADGIEVIHTYITGLLLRPTTGESNFYVTLPSINREPGSSESDYLTNNDKDNSMNHKKLMKFKRNFDAFDENFCKNSSLQIVYPKHEISIEEFRNKIKQANESIDFGEVKEFYRRTFSSLIELNAVFKLYPDKDEAVLNDPELKFDLLFEVYDELDNLPSLMTKTVLKEIMTALSLKELLPSKDEVRGLFMLLQNPIFSYQTSYNVFALLVKQIVSLSTTDHKLLIHWFLRLEPERFRQIVKRLLQFITIREFPPGNGSKLPSISKSRWWIPSATRVLALLNAANNKVVPNLINYTEFYNYAIDHINLMSEYYRWQNPTKTNKFSYCQYPFILSIVAKKSILQRDSEQQMILNARQSLINHAIIQQIPDIDVFFLNLHIRRSHLVADSLNEIAKKQDDLKKKLKVIFVGEPGLDMGGLTKEWFLLLIKQIFHEEYGMFVYHNKSRCYWFSTSKNGNLKEYNLIGVLMGLAVYNSIILDLKFPTACFKKLLSPPVVPRERDKTSAGMCDFTLDDFSQVMPDVAIGLKELLAYEGNVEEDFCMTFQVSVEEFGHVRTHILKLGGEGIAVTNENREEYVKLYIDLILNKAIKYSFKAFYLGFHSVCASNALIMLRPEEVEMLACGSPNIDMEELRKVTVYDGYHEDEYFIKQFWNVVKSFDIEMQKQFLRFTTGSDRAPVGGMGEMTFKISALYKNKEMLPISHTCFNQLVLPRYDNKETLREKLIIAISNAEGFGLE